MSKHATSDERGLFRALIKVAAIAVVVLLPVIGLKMLPEDGESLSATGTIALGPGQRMLYVLDEHVTALPLTPAGQATAGAPVVSDLICARVYAARSTGLCLRRTNAVSWSATLLDRNLQPTTSWTLPGAPAQARVSPSGRMVAWTALESGTALSGSFSAITSIVDTVSGSQVDNLETFAVTTGRDRKKITGHQVWGVTFRDDNRFYATIGVGGKRYLAVGDVDKRTLRTIQADGSNPAVSPDGRKLAFIRPGSGERGHGRLAVLDLATKAVTDLGDQRAVSEQPVWFTNEVVGYVIRSADGTPSIWTTSLDRRSRPVLLVDAADSPSPS